MSKEQLLFCPLGGSGEIGMNLNLYAYGKKDNEKWIVVDMGVTFADDSIPGIDLIYPDPGFLIEKKKDLLGIVLTHAHEDHIGSVAVIWPELKCKIYATPFTAALVREKFKEKKIDITNYLQIVKLNGNVKLGEFDIEFITLTHSILEPNGLSIKTPTGIILHTGDWKCDPNPLIGEKVDQKKRKEIGNQNVLAMICDSTNVFNEGRAGSESDVRESLLDIISKQKKKIVAFPKDIMSEVVYGAESRLMEYLRSKGVIQFDSIQGGNIYGSLEGKILESKDHDEMSMTVYELSEWMKSEGWGSKSGCGGKQLTVGSCVETKRDVKVF